MTATNHLMLEVVFETHTLRGVYQQIDVAKKLGVGKCQRKTVPTVKQERLYLRLLQ